MAPINMPELLEQLTTSVLNLAETTLKNYISEAKTDGQRLLNSLKDDLTRWTQQLAAGNISVQDFEWLVYGQKDIVEMAALKEAGLAEIRATQFRDSLINLIIDTVLHVVK